MFGDDDPQGDDECVCGHWLDDHNAGFEMDCRLCPCIEFEHDE